jgi:hypothetical protein
MITKVMEHVRQCSDQHAARSFEIAEDPPVSWRMSNMVPVRPFPGLHLSDKALTVDFSVNSDYLKKECSQTFRISTFRKATTPTEALTLNVHETTLNHDPRPHKPQGLDKVRIAIHGSTFWPRRSLYQGCANALHVSRTFRDILGIVDDAGPFSIHHSEDPSTTFEKCTIENEVASVREQRTHRGWMLEPICDESSDRGHTVTTLFG